MDSCQTCAFHYYRCITEFYEDNDKSVEFLRSHGVLPAVVTCPICKTHCNYRRDQRLWRCRKSYPVPKTKKRIYCDYSVSDFKGSFVGNSNIPPWKIVLFVNHFISHLWDHKTILQCLKLSSKSLVDWQSFCYEVTEEWFSNQEPIGGERVEVEIDETLIFHRKEERDRVKSQIWLFGGVERVSKRRFVVAFTGPVAEERDKTTLHPLIRKYVRPGSVVYSGSWAAHKITSDLGYKHFVTSHPENGVDRTNKAIHTKNIERVWRDVKEWMKRPGIRSKNQYQYLVRCLFISSVQDKQNLLHQFFIEAAKLYPPLSDCQRPINHKESYSESEDESDPAFP